MSPKKKRGVAKCKKKFLHPEDCQVDFDEQGRPAGKNAGEFMSWVGLEFKKRIPYNKLARRVDPKDFDSIWEYAKETWNIPNDDGKKITLEKGKTIMRNFRYNLRKKYVYKDKSPDKETDTNDTHIDTNSDTDKDKDKTIVEDEGLSPFVDYDYLDKRLWESFVEVVNTKEWKEKSQKARHSALQNTDPARVGRSGLVGLEPHIESRWKQLIETYPSLDVIEGDYAKMLTVSKARYNPVRKIYELGEDLVSEGKLKGKLEELVTKKNNSKFVEKVVGDGPGIYGSSCAFGTSYNELPEILSIQRCELLDPVCQVAPKVIGMGRVHPTRERIIHNVRMADGFVKIQVDRVEEGCGSTRLLPESCISGEVECLEDAKGCFIQWPIKSIKIINKDSPLTLESSHHSISTLYRPQFEATSAHQQQTISDERNEYQIYSYALQDDEAFNQLLDDKQLLPNTTEQESFYKHNEPVDVNQSTNILDSNQPLKSVAPKPLKEKAKVPKEKAKIIKLLELSRKRPQSICALAQQVADQSKTTLSMVFTSPTGMYEDRIEETIEFEAILQLCVNGLTDVCFVHWFTMYLYAIGRNEGLNNTAYFHPRYIEGAMVLDDCDFVIDHIENVISFHNDKQWFMAPHIVGRHWVLILLQHHPVFKTWKGYIFDSLKGTKDHSDYEITELFEKTIKQKITWDMVNCRQQPKRWECGYCVMMAMYDFVICNREHMLVNKTKMVRQGEIDEFVERTLKVFVSSFGDGEVEMDE